MIVPALALNHSQRHAAALGTQFHLCIIEPELLFFYTNHIAYKYVFMNKVSYHCKF